MTTAVDLLVRVYSSGGSICADGDVLRLDVPGDFPDSLIEQLRQHKPDILELLREQERQQNKETYQQAFPGNDPDDTEIAEIERRVKESGYVLCWAESFIDYVAFHRDDVDPTDIPPGFVPYSESELSLLFGPERPDLTTHTLKLIHAAKKSGARVSDVYPDDAQG